MEKFSAYRDAGTGIQPFLYPVPPNMPDVIARVIHPLGVLLGIGRTLLILLISVLYLTCEISLSVLYLFNEPLYDLLSWIQTAFWSRLVLWILGFYWINVSYITKARGRKASKLPWQPGAGDIIVSNWASWIEILWLAFRFNPIFLLPVPSEPSEEKTQVDTATIPRRRIVTSPSATRSSSIQIPIKGYERVSLLRMLSLTGNVPPYSSTGSNVQTLDELQAIVTRPLVIFPECTTSNGRAILKFLPTLNLPSASATKFKIFVMSVRYDPPTLYTPSLTHPIPSKFLNPLGHIFTICCSLSPLLYQSLSIRLLNPAESPSGSDTSSGSDYSGDLSQACASLISQLGKLRSTGLGWEDKASFLDFYRSKLDRS